MKIINSLKLALAGCFLASVTLAQMPDLPEFRARGSGHEYFLGKGEGKPLIRVNVIGGVNTPGVYHIPIGTNLGELVAYSGGVVPGAELDSIRVSSRNSSLESSMKVYDYYSLSKNINEFPMLGNGDFVQIDVHEDRLARSALIVAILGTLASVTFSYLNYQNGK